jgi:hypothetical protein
VKGASRKQHFRLDAEGRKLRALVEEVDRKQGNWDRPRSKAVVVSEAELLALGGVKKTVWYKDGYQSRIIFGGERETRLTFIPDNGAWKVELEELEKKLQGKPSLTPSLEEIIRELCKAGRGLWNTEERKPDIAFQAVDALLTYSRDWQDFAALPKSKQEKTDVYRAMVNVQLAILTTLQALERDVKNKGRKLQLAFELLTDHQ